MAEYDIFKFGLLILFSRKIFGSSIITTSAAAVFAFGIINATIINMVPIPLLYNESVHILLIKIFEMLKPEDFRITSEY